jgi:predicted nucleic acid-binding protein
MEYSLATTTITIFEIYQGSNEAQSGFWDILFDRLQLFSFDEEAAKLAAVLANRLMRQNRLIAKPDLFIAAIAITNKLSLATLNSKDFNRLQELKLIQPDS